MKKELTEALSKIEIVDKNLIELQEMGYEVTFNTSASVREQMASRYEED